MLSQQILTRVERKRVSVFVPPKLAEKERLAKKAGLYVKWNALFKNQGLKAIGAVFIEL